MKRLKLTYVIASGVVALLLAVIPESVFKIIELFENDNCNIITNRMICIAVVILITYVGVVLFQKLRRSKVISGSKYKIIIEYGDILKDVNGKRVINFDECFTTKVGEGKADIKKSSVCGQYLEKNKDIDVHALIREYKLKPSELPSKYHKKRYESGTLVPYKNDLLMAFAKLDEEGVALLTYDEYLSALNLLWKEINAYSGGVDVYIPLLGAGKTRIGDTELTKQELLGIIIGSYKLSHFKLKLPSKLHVICQKDASFSLEEIE